ncbi:hypothetical protein [Methylomarinum vadi]|uniref:hypothetical protein n=1 Tax=Methylomarinum vadi TaxID=438855 RepID=UPI0004DF58CF|nr:hypothetical protein [Methylomarinum vadi]
MKIIKLCTDFMTISVFYIYSGYALAEEFEPEPSFKYAPLIIFLALLVIFRKKLIAEATPHPHGEEEHHGAEESATKTDAETLQSERIEEKTKVTQPAQEEIIDMSQKVEQCQAATAKGSRCSRTANLETIEVSVEGKFYRFKTCRQHNNESFKPFLS